MVQDSKQQNLEQLVKEYENVRGALVVVLAWLHCGQPSDAKSEIESMIETTLYHDEMYKDDAA